MSIPLSISRLIIFLNFFSFEDHVTVLAMALIKNPADRLIQNPPDPKTAWKNKNKKVASIMVAMKVPTPIYNA